jgi:peptidoglycan/xylan/chitin deacetylase (PgdA/CDA1 family)
MRWAALLALVACTNAGDDPILGDTGFDTDTGVPAESDTDGADTDVPDEPDPEPTPVDEVRRHDCGGIEPADVGPFGGRIALTFDDGPHLTHTVSIVDTLRARNIPATFFVLGQRVADMSTWTLVDELVADPLFDLANHSWDHPDFTTLAPIARRAQIEDTQDILATFGADSPFFRFPFGSSNCATHDDVTDRGYSVTGWHIDTADWCYANLGVPGTCTQDDYWRIPLEYESDMRGFIVEQALRYDGGILLLHDIHGWVADELPAILDDLEDAGFTFVALDDATTFPNLVANTPEDIPYLGEACDPANDLCFHAEYFAWCEPTTPAGDVGVCTMPCEGLCPDRDGAATTFCAEVSTGAGQCTSYAEDLNGDCPDVPGTSPRSMDRHVGASGVSSATRTVCAPTDW